MTAKQRRRRRRWSGVEGWGQRAAPVEQRRKALAEALGEHAGGADEVGALIRVARRQRRVKVGDDEQLVQPCISQHGLVLLVKGGGGQKGRVGALALEAAPVGQVKQRRADQRRAANDGVLRLHGGVSSKNARPSGAPQSTTSVSQFDPHRKYVTSSHLITHALLRTR